MIALHIPLRRLASEHPVMRVIGVMCGSTRVILHILLRRLASEHREPSRGWSASRA